MRRISLLRIPHHLLPRIFFSMEPAELLRLTACSTTTRKMMVLKRAFPFLMETVSSPSIHQISFVFVDGVPCKVSFTVSTHDVDWMHCPYTVREQLEKGIGSEESHERLFRWVKYLSEVFAAGFQMGTVELTDGNGDTFMARMMRGKPEANTPADKIIRRLVKLSNCSHVNVKEFLYLWNRLRLPRLASLHLYPLQDCEPVVREDDSSEIENFRTKFGDRWSEVIGGEDINPHLIYGISGTKPRIRQYIRPQDPVQTRLLPEIFYNCGSLYGFAYFAWTAIDVLITLYRTPLPLSTPLFITVFALGATTMFSIVGLATAFRDWKFYMLDDWVLFLFFTATGLCIVGTLICHCFVLNLI